jgi:site-specific DNA-methyltransferase (adenine-specific)
MGKDWDHGIPGVHFWIEALRVAKPGAMLLAFGGTRTHHRLMCAIEDAGWEIRDCLMWLYGSGFPKSLDVSKAIDKAAGAERENGAPLVDPARNKGRTVALDGSWQEHPYCTLPATPAAAEWNGWGTALKPAWEPIILAMKPLDGTFARNATTWGVAGLNVEGGRIGTNGETLSFANGTGRHNTHERDPWQSTNGRWPANVLLDEEAAAMLDEQSADVDAGASRFFYVAKASRAERERGLEGAESRLCLRYSEKAQGPLPQQTPSIPTQQRNYHPTVKPLELMQYLCRLTATPTGGIILDPFMGSGTTGMAAISTARQFIGIELDPDYCEIARRRIMATQPGLL